MSPKGFRNRKLELCFTPDGKVELVTDKDIVIWESDGDEDFNEKMAQELYGYADCERIINYMIAADLISREEAHELDIFEESDAEIEESSDEDLDVDDDEEED
jgi:hypothetical protein